MRRNLETALRYTLATTFLFGVVYPVVVTAASQLFFREKANGQLIQRDGEIVGSRLLGQAFSSPAYFHSRPSAAGAGYDAANSGGSNYGPTNQKLVDRIKGDAASDASDNPGHDVPIDLVTASASGLDPDITPASATYQLDRVARARQLQISAVQEMVRRNTRGRQFGFLGEPRVNVLALNLDLDRVAPLPRSGH